MYFNDVVQKLPKKGRDCGLDNLAVERFEVKVTVIISIVITSSVHTVASPPYSIHLGKKYAIPSH